MALTAMQVCMEVAARMMVEVYKEERVGRREVGVPKVVVGVAAEAL